MSKLSSEHRFLDFSDYGRLPARWIALALRRTPVTPVHVTLLFGVTGVLAIVCMLQGQYLAAGALLILKSILDAADGELSRVKNTPSYTGRYLDSIFDLLLNLGFVATICLITHGSWWVAALAWIAIQLQGTLYNYYYVILRHRLAGSDTTSRILETEPPTAMPGESQLSVNRLFRIFHGLYGGFDGLIYRLDPDAIAAPPLPKLFMSVISLYGLGFQLLLMAVMLALGLSAWILPFFCAYSLPMALLIAIRRHWLGPVGMTKPCPAQVLLPGSDQLN